MTDKEIIGLAQQWPCRENDWADAIDFARAIIQADRAQRQAQQYDQTALELCGKCGWKTVIPGEGCLNCKFEAQRQADPVTIAYMAGVEDGKGRRQAGQEPVVLIDNGTLFWNIPTPTYSVPLHLLQGKHWLYAAPQPAPVPLTGEQIESTIRNWFADDWAIDKARGLLGDLGICP